jgi:HK97 gp10 family phage protein
MAQVKFDMKAAMAPLEKAQKGLVAIGLQLEGDIKRSISGAGPSIPGAPPGVDTGRLRASISTNWSDSPMDRGKVGGQALDSEGVGKPEKMGGKFTVVVGSNVTYAPFLEFGTRRMPARPFVRPAFDRIKNRIANLITKET